MSDNSKPTCRKCGTELVPAKENTTLNGKLPLDGSWNFNNEVCPKCHPDLAETNQ